MKEILGQRLIEESPNYDLSTYENLAMTKQFFYVIEYGSRFVGFEIKFFEVLLDQLPFFPTKALTECLHTMFVTRKLNILVRRNTLRALLNILMMYYDLVVRNMS